ncbi:MAG TPA: sporulation transcriptional regulator SpoIIID [Clostridia bacterium]|jgi:putative DeoR family transcriptional regulator (stage III sporulation protein D)
MREYIIKRALDLGYYFVENKKTVREAAKVFNISKSTVHKDITERLPEIDEDLFEQVRRVLDINLSERHIRGGLATKIKYLKSKKSVPENP